jgi:hypothetical protein
MQQLTLTEDREVPWLEVPRHGSSNRLPWERAAQAILEPKTKLIVARESTEQAA